MSWLTIYLIGACVTFFITVANEAHNGRAEEEVWACMFSGIMWPLAWLYAAGALVGESLRK